MEAQSFGKYHSGAEWRASGEIRGANDAAFSLIELMIVVAIILIIAAIAIPNFMRSRIAANEAAAVASMRAINSAEIVYSSQYQTGYSSTLLDLGQPASGIPSSTAAGLIDDVLAGGKKSGYLFLYSPGNLSGSFYGSYSLNANPFIPERTGVRYFYTDTGGVIRVAFGSQAGPSDTPLQ